MFKTKPTPISYDVVYHFPIEEVKDAITTVIKRYSFFFIPVKNGLDNEAGTYDFIRPKGVDTISVRIVLTAKGECETAMHVTCSAPSFTVFTSDLQTSANELYNIFLAYMRGASDSEMKRTIKENDSGSLGGCLKTIIFCLICLAAAIYIITTLLNLIL